MLSGLHEEASYELREVETDGRSSLSSYRIIIESPGAVDGDAGGYLVWEVEGQTARSERRSGWGAACVNI